MFHLSTRISCSDKPSQLWNSASTKVLLDLQITDWDAAKSCKIISAPKSVGFGDFPFQTGTVYHSSVRFDGFTNKQWTDVTVHKSFLKITGSLEYNDGFGMIRETGLCFRYDGNWEVCPTAEDGTSCSAQARGAGGNTR
jgi:hypothetical protein